MSKYDTYTLTLRLGEEPSAATLEISILFEDGDSVASVLTDARTKLKAEAIKMKNSEFLKDIEP